jgi:hypothetical protein
MFQDGCGHSLHIGSFVSVDDTEEAEEWRIISFIDQPLELTVILENTTTKESIWIPISLITFKRD